MKISCLLPGCGEQAARRSALVAHSIRITSSRRFRALGRYTPRQCTHTEQLDFSQRRHRTLAVAGVILRRTRCAHRLVRAARSNNGRRSCAGRATAHQQQQHYSDDRSDRSHTTASSLGLHAIPSRVQTHVVYASLYSIDPVFECQLLLFLMCGKVQTISKSSRKYLELLLMVRRAGIEPARLLVKGF